MPLDHCHVCEFRQRCRKQAEEADDISLLSGLGEKELKRYNRKGIFTLTQLAHTFRPRRKGKRAAQKEHNRQHALQALAIRDKRIYVFGTPEMPRGKVRLYLDIERVLDEGSVYLIGLGVPPAEFNSYGARRGNHEVMVRGTFASIRLRNRLAPGT